jgi:hypothetical protein
MALAIWEYLRVAPPRFSSVDAALLSLSLSCFILLGAPLFDDVDAAMLSYNTHTR